MYSIATRSEALFLFLSKIILTCLYSIFKAWQNWLLEPPSKHNFYKLSRILIVQADSFDFDNKKEGWTSRKNYREYTSNQFN